MKPYIHAESSVKQFGGKPEDYLPIHEFLDSSKAIIADHRHRIFTHNTWFLMVLERVFGSVITNSEGKKVSVRDIGEQHILEDFRGNFIPSANDWLAHLEYAPWMNNGAESPQSVRIVHRPAPAPIKLPERAQITRWPDPDPIDLISSPPRLPWNAPWPEIVD